jgi:hypothetical protein
MKLLSIKLYDRPAKKYVALSVIYYIYFSFLVVKKNIKEDYSESKKKIQKNPNIQILPPKIESPPKK